MTATFVPARKSSPLMAVQNSVTLAWRSVLKIKTNPEGAASDGKCCRQAAIPKPVAAGAAGILTIAFPAVR